MAYKDSEERADRFSKDLEKSLLEKVQMIVSCISPPKNAIKSALSVCAFGVEFILEWELGGKNKGHVQISLKTIAEFLRLHNEIQIFFFLIKCLIF